MVQNDSGLNERAAGVSLRTLTMHRDHFRAEETGARPAPARPRFVEPMAALASIASRSDAIQSTKRVAGVGLGESSEST